MRIRIARSKKDAVLFAASHMFTTRVNVLPCGQALGVVDSFDVIRFSPFNDMIVGLRLVS